MTDFISILVPLESADTFRSVHTTGLFFGHSKKTQGVKNSKLKRKTQNSS